MRELKDLPNRSGFKFIGVLKDGTTKDCEIAYGPDNMITNCGRPYSAVILPESIYYVKGVRFNLLAGWYHVHEKHLIDRTPDASKELDLTV